MRNLLLPGKKLKFLLGRRKRHSKSLPIGIVKELWQLQTWKGRPFFDGKNLINLASGRQSACASVCVVEGFQSRTGEKEKSLYFWAVKRENEEGGLKGRVPQKLSRLEKSARLLKSSFYDKGRPIWKPRQKIQSPSNNHNCCCLDDQLQPGGESWSLTSE